MTRGREGRPAGNRTATDLGGNQINRADSTAPHPQEALTYARRAWARALIERAKPHPLPAYGSAEWLSLPDAHPAKVGAVVVAAESWVTDAENAPTSLLTEVEALARGHKSAEDAAYVDGMDAHRQEWQHLARRLPTGQRGDASTPLEELGRRHRLEVIEGGRGRGGAA